MNTLELNRRRAADRFFDQNSGVRVAVTDAAGQNAGTIRAYIDSDDTTGWSFHPAISPVGRAAYEAVGGYGYWRRLDQAKAALVESGYVVA